MSKYFEKIPKVETSGKKDPRDNILDNLRKIYEKKKEREFFVQQKRDIHKKIYNLSLEIKKIEETNETIMIKTGLLQ